MADVVPEQKPKTVPYVSFKTWKSFLGLLRDKGVPHVIDRSALPQFNGSVYKQIIATLEYFSLVTPKGEPTGPQLEALVIGNDDDRRETIKKLLGRHYPYIVGKIDLSKATSKQVKDALRDNGNVQGETIDKAYSFFLSMAREAGIPLSAHITTRAVSPRKRERRTAVLRPATLVSIPRRDDEDDADGPEMFTHIFPLRRKVTVRVSLPLDLTKRDVERLATWLDTIAFDDEGPEEEVETDDSATLNDSDEQPTE